MGKKRRTKTQKIIAQLKRELQRQQKQEFVGLSKPLEKKSTMTSDKKASGVVVKYENLQETTKQTKEKTDKINFYTYSPQLIKKDLFKTFYLSGIFFFLIGFCYWYFEVGGEKILNSLVR